VGQIAGMVEILGESPSVLQREVSALSRFTAVAAVLAGTLTLIVANIFTDVGFLASLTFSTGVIVALVPEGLLPTLSVSLAMGAQRMAQRGAAIRRLSAVESVGAVTVVCTDKTGTLTANTLTVAGIVENGEPGGDKRAILEAAVYCNDAYQDDAGRWSGDAIDVALAEWASAERIGVDALRARVQKSPGMPFDASRRLMTVLCSLDGNEFEVAKGAPEAVIEITGVRVSDYLMEQVHAAAGLGERVLMFAVRRGSEWRTCGAIRLADPLRPEVPGAIAACSRAGIRVIMVTGDHPRTAQTVARNAGLASAAVNTGADVDSMSDLQLLSALREQAIFARIDPQQKLRIARVLKEAGEIVVMTGDGINDAPALEAADVGVAMGKRGTEVAKQAADIVLSDDNFATIVAAIEEGRAIKLNIRRFASYVFTSNVAELIPFVLYIFLRIPLPLAVIQVLAIDLGTDLLPALALGAEPASPRAMATPPEPPRRPLLTTDLMLKTFAFLGPIEAVLGVGAFFAFFVVAGWRPFESFAAFDDLSPAARSLTFVGIVAGQVGCVFAQRDGSLRSRLSLTSNPWILFGVAVEIVLVFALVYVPGLSGMFKMQRVEVGWMLLLPLGAAVFIVLDLVRRIFVSLRTSPPTLPA
jgi:magnesium-transporting ATPase (P-type)